MSVKSSHPVWDVGDWNCDQSGSLFREVGSWFSLPVVFVSFLGAET